MLINERFFTKKIFALKKVLLSECTVAGSIIFIIKGCIRAWYNADGQEITLRFFFEGDSVTSLESFMNDIPGNICIETLEECEVCVLSKADFSHLVATDENIKIGFTK